MKITDTNLTRYFTHYFLLLVTFFLFNKVSGQKTDSLPVNIEQTPQVFQELGFIAHLMDNREFKDVITLINGNTLLSNISLNQKDSIKYYKGWAFYNLKQLDSSIVHLKNVSLTSPFYNKSQFYTGFNYAYIGKRDEATSVFNQLKAFKGDSSELEALKYFELGGISLLDRNYSQFDSLMQKSSFNFFSMQGEQKKLLEYKEDLVRVKKKSPVVAGLMSAIIPGSGKYYAGHKGQALGAFIPSLIVGAVTYESYKKAGPRSFQFIAFSSMFTVLYVGNIFGSVLSVKIRRDEINQLVDHNILVNMHIPLRRVFDR